MASRVEAFVLGVGSAFGATALGHGVAVGEVPPGLLYLAAFCAFLAIAQAVRLGVLSVQQEGEHRG